MVNHHFPESSNALALQTWICWSPCVASTERKDILKDLRTLIKMAFIALQLYKIFIPVVYSQIVGYVMSLITMSDGHTSQVPVRSLCHALFSTESGGLAHPLIMAPIVKSLHPGVYLVGYKVSLIAVSDGQTSQVPVRSLCHTYR